jgi:iron complex outermembrane recepter protein
MKTWLIDSPGIYRCRTLFLAALLAGTGVVSGNAETLPSLPPALNSGETAQTATGTETELAEVQVRDKKEVKPPAREGSAESGYRTSSATAGPLGTVPLRDTPYSVNVTPGELFENRQAHTTSDALRTNPTVASLMESSGYSSLSRVMIRGFTAADQSELRDGLVDRSFTFPPLENVERIEVMNGLSGFLYGFSALGGTINYVTKQPTTEPLAKLSGGWYGGGINYIHADFGGTAPYTQERLTGRFNIYHEDGSTYIDGGNQKRTLVSSALNLRLLPGTVLKADMYYQNYDIHGLQTYFDASSGNWTGTGIRVPSASQFNPSKQYGQSWTYNRSEKILLGLGLESKLNEIFTLRAAYRYGTMWRRYLFAGATLLDNDGNYSEKLTATPRQEEITRSAYALVDAHFDTWNVHHDLTFGYTGTNYYYSRGADVSTALGTSNITSPAVYEDPGLTVGETTTYQKQYMDNFLIGDRITLNRFLSVLMGVNFAQVRQKAGGASTGISTSTFTQNRFTPSFGLIYKPIPFISTYFSYSQGLAAGGTAPSTAVNANQMLKPSVSEQYEIGAKAALWGMDMTLALFRIDKVNEYTDPNDKIYKQDGREVHQGVEMTVSGKPLERLTAVGGFTLMDAAYERAANNPKIEGKTPVNVPQEQARIYLEYQLPFVDNNLYVNAGANYFGRRPVDALNTSYISGATTFDTGLRYQPLIWGHRITMNLNLTNIFDKRYWSYYRSGDGLLLGAPRLVSFSAKVDW